MWKGREYSRQGGFGATKGKRKAPLGTQQVRDAFILTGYPFVSLELGQRCWFTAAHQISLSLSLSAFILSSLFCFLSDRKCNLDWLINLLRGLWSNVVDRVTRSRQLFLSPSVMINCFCLRGIRNEKFDWNEGVESYDIYLKILSHIWVISRIYKI